MSKEPGLSGPRFSLGEARLLLPELFPRCPAIPGEAVLPRSGFLAVSPCLCVSLVLLPSCFPFAGVFEPAGCLPLSGFLELGSAAGEGSRLAWREERGPLGALHNGNDHSCSSTRLLVTSKSPHGGDGLMVGLWETLCLERY